VEVVEQKDGANCDQDNRGHHAFGRAGILAAA
jgi:hypothetical protein